MDINLELSTHFLLPIYLSKQKATTSIYGLLTLKHSLEYIVYVVCMCVRVHGSAHLHIRVHVRVS